MLARAQRGADDPDALYRDRDNARQRDARGADWAARLAANPKDFESAWKLARAQYWLGTNGLPERDRKAALEAGIAAGRKAVAHRPRSVPKAISGSPPTWARSPNRSACARASSIAGRFATSSRRVLKIDPGVSAGSADRALGRWYYKVPGLFGGDKKKSEEHLRKALAYNPQSVITRLFLAETLIELDRKAEARKELEAAIAAPDDPEWVPEDRGFRRAGDARCSRALK